MHILNVDNMIRNKLKSLDPIHLRILWTQREQSILVFVYTNKEYTSFSYHTQIKLIKKSKRHVNSKLKVLSNNMFRISWLRTMDIHRWIERLGQWLGIKGGVSIRSFLVPQGLEWKFDILLNNFSPTQNLI